MASKATAGQVPDVYGQLHPVETPELISQSLCNFQEEIGKIPQSEKVCVLEAQEKCPELLTDEFKLMFLRSEVFNADLAAARFVRYWKQRVEIFGPDKAFQPLTLSDALSEDTVALEREFFTPTGSFDQKGRGIIFANPSVHDKTLYPQESMCRALWYFLHTVLEHESAQKHGIVFIIFPRHARLALFDRKLMKMNVDSLKGAIPVRLAALHICHPPTFISVVLPVVKMFMGERLRKRIQVHSGPDEAVLEHLDEKYGIRRESLPTVLGGGLQFDLHNFLEERRKNGQ